jgi:hypothetical protein
MQQLTEKLPEKLENLRLDRGSFISSVYFFVWFIK